MMKKVLFFLFLVLFSSFAYGITVEKGTQFYISLFNFTGEVSQNMTGIEYIAVDAFYIYVKGYGKYLWTFGGVDHNTTPVYWTYLVDPKKVYMNVTENSTVYLYNVSNAVKATVTGEYEVYYNGTLYESSVTSPDYNCTMPGMWYFKSDIVPASFGNISIDYDIFTHETEQVSWSLTMWANVSEDYYDVKLILENGTKFDTVKTIDTIYAVYTSDFSIPIFPNASTIVYEQDYYFSAYYYLNGTTDTTLFTTNVTPLVINASYNLTCNNTGLYIESHDEDTGLLVNTTVELEIEYYWGAGGVGGEEFKTFYYQFNYSKKHKICEVEDYNYNVYVKYMDLLNQTQRWFLRRYNNEDISMYSVTDRTDYTLLKVTVRDKRDYSPLENIYVSLERFYVGEGIWRTVQIDRSDDFGAVAYWVREEDTDYRLVFRDENNSIYDRTEWLKFYCTGECEITYLIDPSALIADYPAIDVVVSYDNDTSILTVLWEVPGGYNVNLITTVTKETFTGSLDVCSMSDVGIAGIQTCDLTGHTGTVYVNVRSTYGGDDGFLYSEVLQLSSSALHTVIDAYEGALWTFGIMLTVIGFGLFSPVGAIIATLFGLITVMFLGIFKAITVTFVIVACVVGIALGLKLRR